MKTIRFTGDAARDLRRHGNMAKRLRKAITEYAADPQAHANNVTKLIEMSGKKLRVGNFRIIFEETDSEILVTKVGPRGNVYG